MVGWDLDLTSNTTEAVPIWRPGQHVVDRSGRGGVVEATSGRRVLLLWGNDQDRAYRGWVEAVELTALDVAGGDP